MRLLALGFRRVSCAQRSLELDYLLLLLQLSARDLDLLQRLQVDVFLCCCWRTRLESFLTVR